jgi:hypothetical protein
MMPSPPEVLILQLVLGLVPAVVASRKGYSFAGFWLLATLFLIVALPLALLLRPRPGSKADRTQPSRV